MPEGRGLFEVARERIRTRHLAFRTEQAYLQWMRRYVKFHGRRHPRDMGPAEVEAFLTHLAVAAKVGASSQNQALQALLFLYRHVLGIELPWLDNVTTFNFHPHLPHYAVTPENSKAIHVLAKQPIDLSRPHPFTEAGNREFNMFLWMPPEGNRAGDIVFADSTIFTTLFGGTESLENFWRNLARPPRAKSARTRVA